VPNREAVSEAVSPECGKFGAVRAVLTLAILLISVSLPAFAVVVNFPDPGLEAAIRDAIGKPTGDIHDTDLSGLTELSASDRGISNIEGIQNCADLERLYLNGNHISDISLLAGLSKLEHLWLQGNSLVNLSALSSIVSLRVLRLSGNAISNVSPLAGLTSLEFLYLDDNLITDIAPLAGLSSLFKLVLWGNQISDITALSVMVSIETLILGFCDGGNQISDISALSNLTNLSLVWLRSNLIVDIAPLVSNAGIGSGDDVSLEWNRLLLGLCSPDMLNIEALQDRGASVTYTPQNWPPATSAAFRVEEGFVFADKTFYAGAWATCACCADIAEWARVSTPVAPGDVVILDQAAPTHYRIAESACSSLVAGVVSTTPGVILGGSLLGSEKAILALVGIVPVKVNDESGAIEPGDLLVTSSTPGYAMRWSGPDPCLCALVGKALEPMTHSEGVILVLLTAH